MATTITMPQLGETVTEGTVAQWLKKVGDSVEKYEPFVEVSTDKVNAEVPSPVSGTIREFIVKEGETVPTGAPIAIIDEIGAASVAPPAHTPSPSEQVADRARAVPSSYGAGGTMEAVRQGAAEPVPGSNVGVPAYGNGAASNGANANGNGAAVTIPRGVSPAVRRLAREHNIDVTRVHGTGSNGRVTANDIVAAATEGPSAAAAAAISADNAEYLARPAAPQVPATSRPAAPSGKTSYANPIPGETIPLTQARKIIAQRMVESKHTAPHAWTMIECDVTNVWKWRAKEKDAFERDYGVKLTLLPFFIRAVVESLGKFPLMNARFTDEGILVHKDVNVGIAIGLETNLIVPVIRNADTLSIKGIALAAGVLIDKARRSKLGADDLSAGTFTVNNTGANGSLMSAPIINGGQAGIITMETIVKRPVVTADDSFAIRSMMNICLSLDHRVVDGFVASGFLNDIRKRLESMGPGQAL